MKRIRPRVLRRVRPELDHLLRHGAWIVLLPTPSIKNTRYVARYVNEFGDAMDAVDEYHRSRGVITRSGTS